MNSPYRDHPDEDALERFLLNHSEEAELEIVETHILACESCITKLENMELNIASARMAVQSMLAEQAKKLASASPRDWKNWFILPHLSWAGAVMAACAFVFVAASLPSHVSLTAYRGSEVIKVPEWRPLQMKLNAIDLTPGPVTIEVVDSQGARIWQGASVVKDDNIDVRVPRLTKEGTYYLRVYSSTEDASSELEREFSVETKPLF